MILASQNVQIAEEKDFVREKISGIFFVNTVHSCIGSRFAFLRTEAGLNPPLEERGLVNGCLLCPIQ